MGIAIASADVEDRRALSNILAKQDVDAVAASTVRDCEQIMGQEPVGLIFCARALADGDYRDVLKASRAARPRTRSVLTICATDWDEYVEAMRLGALDVISAPCQPTDVDCMIIQALRDEHARNRHRMLTEQAASTFRTEEAAPSHGHAELANLSGRRLYRLRKNAQSVVPRG